MNDTGRPHEAHAPSSSAPEPTYPGPPPGWPPSPPVEPDRTSRLAIAAMVLGLLGFVRLAIVLAVIFALFALRAIRRNGLAGRPFAYAGLGASALWVLAHIGLTLLDNLGSDAERDEAGRITEAGTISSVDLRIGDCFNLPDGATEIDDVSGVQCGQPHDAEAYGVFELDGDDFPGQQIVIRQADRGCVDRFADFVGLAYQKSELEVYYVYPTEYTWNQLSDREVVCAVVEPEGKTTVETLEGANR